MYPTRPPHVQRDQILSCLTSATPRCARQRLETPPPPLSAPTLTHVIRRSATGPNESEPWRMGRPATRRRFLRETPIWASSHSSLSRPQPLGALRLGRPSPARGIPSRASSSSAAAAPRPRGQPRRRPPSEKVVPGGASLSAPGPERKRCPSRSSRHPGGEPGSVAAAAAHLESQLAPGSDRPLCAPHRRHQQHLLQAELVLRLLAGPVP